MSDDSIPWLRDNTILLTVAGSMAYGTFTDGSDVDVKGVAIPPLSYFIGFLQHFDQADKPLHAAKFYDALTRNMQERADRTKLEGTITDLRKFMTLAADCNPNILDVLFCREEEVMLCTPIGRMLRDNRQMFISRVANYRFGGYAMSQLGRIEGHRGWLLDPPTTPPMREDFDLRPLPEIPPDQLHAVKAQVQKQIDRWNEGFMDDLPEAAKDRVKEGLAQYLAELRINSEIRFVSAARGIGLEENFIEYLKKERAFDAAMKRWKSYLDWKSHRNEDRAKLEAKYGYDTKHAGHLTRLLLMREEILTTGEVNVWRKDADFILRIRNGELTYDQLMAWVRERCEGVEEMMEKSPLPKAPNRKKIDALCQEMVCRHLGI